MFHVKSERIPSLLFGQAATTEPKRAVPMYGASHVLLAISSLAALVSVGGLFSMVRSIQGRERGTQINTPRDGGLKRIERVMNRTISPCNDFVGYVCSRWKKIHPGISSPFKLVEEEVLFRAESDLLKAVVDPLQTLAVEKVTAAVQNCYAVSVSKAENLHVLNEFLANNGLQLPAGSDQAVPGPLELLVTLNLRLGIPLLLNLRPAIDLRTDDQMILTVMTDTDYLIQFNLVSNTIKKTLYFNFLLCLH